MKRTKLADRILPTYTKGEEIFNMVSHIVGGVAGIATIVLCSVFAGIRHNAYGVVSGVIFGVSMLFLYTMSSIYHGLSPKLKSKKVLQVLDHCAIFVLIAGSYTPFALCTIRGYDAFAGWMIFGIIWTIAIFGVIWAFAILGITLNAIDLKKYKVFSMICYLAMGWCIIIKVNLLPSLLGIPGFVLLVAGGIIYTIGAILYGVGKKHKYMHSIFHLCVFLGNILHVLCVLLYVI